MAENRTEIKQREYLIGDMSEIVGVSRDTLRFYEKKGIIKSRKKENGYRYYLEEDILRLMFIVYRRKMNQSLEEIERYIKEENSLECMKEHLAMRIKQEEASIQYHQQAIARMQLAERDMDQAEKYEGIFSPEQLNIFPYTIICGNIALLLPTAKARIMKGNGNRLLK